MCGAAVLGKEIQYDEYYCSHSNDDPDDIEDEFLFHSHSPFRARSVCCGDAASIVLFPLVCKLLYTREEEK